MPATDMTAASAVPANSRRVRVGVDVGGTFTDLVALADGEIVTAKVRSVRADQSEAVLAVLDASRLSPGEIDVFAHGTTVATNALLERRGARTALVTTAGFRDVIEIGRQNRPSLYNLAVPPPPPLVQRDLRFTVDERIGPTGVVRELDERQLDDLIGALREAGAESVAVCLLFSFAEPGHEERVHLRLSEALPDVYVASSSRVLPEFREFERFATTTANAYLGPVLGAYLGRLDRRLSELGVGRPLVMLSSGGVVDLPAAADQASQCVLSGPAAGVVAAAWVAGQSGFADLLTFDMGGTSTDVSLVLDGEVQVTTSSVIAGVPIKHPMVDVHTVSSGGGSIAWIDSGAALRVGPTSAGGEPGPACYGLGGDAPTVTDAHVVLGYLPDGAMFGDGLALRRDLATGAIAGISDTLGVDLTEAAAGIVAVAEAEMIRALRVVSVERGVDPRRLTLVAFGGAGGVHACGLAEKLQMDAVLVPASAGVLSALGLAICDLRRDYVAAHFTRVDGLSESDLEDAFTQLELRARRELSSPRCERFADVRYVGQSFELTVPAGDASELSRLFVDAHRRRYDHTQGSTPLEIVAVRLRATVPIPRPPLRPDGGGTTSGGIQPPASRSAFFDTEWMDATVIEGASLAFGQRVEGPAIIEFPIATCVVRPGWSGTVDQAGAVVLRRGPGGP